MAIKDDSWLEHFLNDQERELRGKCQFLVAVQRQEVWGRAISISSTRENLPIARTYTVEVTAAGFKRRSRSATPTEITAHKFDIHVLRTFPDWNEGMGAPIRVVWRSDIFHPNIMTGTDGGGRGYVCWARTDPRKGKEGWQRDDRLLTIVEGIKGLVERPNLKDPLNGEPECREAADWYKRNHPEGLELEREASLRRDFVLRRGRDGS